MITSRKNEQLKIIRRALRCKADWALLEGPHLISEALVAGHTPRSILATPTFLDSGAARALLPKLPYRPLTLAPELLAEVTDSDSPRGIISLIPLSRPQADALRFSARSVIVYADGLQDPGNLGALARSAEAAGAAALCLSPSSVHPNHPRALRASAGSLLRLPIAVDCPVEQLEAQLADHRPRWLGLTQRGGQSLYEANFDGCLVLALGAEASGLSVNVQDHLTQAITIPTQPPVESLNATVAASIVLFEIARRQSEGQRVTQPTREAQA